MKCAAMSATRLNVWCQCGWRYRCMYHSYLPRIDSIFFKLGTAVHQTLEFAGRLVRDEYGRDFTGEEVSQIMDQFIKCAAKERIEDTTLLKDGQDMVMNKLRDFSVGREILSLERRFRVETEEGVPLIGAMDKIVKIDDNTIGVVDYKTNKFASSAHELRSDSQLSIYDLAASLMYPEYKKIVLIMDYLRTKPVFSYRTPEERETFSKYVKAVYDEILATEEDDLKPNLNRFCANCDYKTHCPKYAKVMFGTDRTYKPAEILTNDELIQEYDNIKNTKKVVEARERELKMIVAERIREAGDDLYGEDKKVVVKQTSRLMYDMDTILDLLPPRDLRQVIAINKRNMDRYLNDVRPDLRDKVMETASFNFNAPWFDVQGHDGGNDGEEDE